MIRRVVLALLTAIVLVTAPLAFAGSYLQTAVCSTVTDCQPGIPASVDPNVSSDRVPPRGIVHPLEYDGGAGGVIQLKICLALGDAEFGGPLRRAIHTWNGLASTVDNCLGTGCKVWEETSLPLDGEDGPIKAHAESILLHELGHCALGFDGSHPIETLAGKVGILQRQCGPFGTGHR